MNKVVRKLGMLGVAVVLAAGASVAVAGPASALGGVNSGNYYGHSYLQSGTNFLSVQTLYQNTTTNTRVCAQGLAAGNLITGKARVCGAKSFAQWDSNATYDAPGGRHWKADDSYFRS